MIGFMEGQVGGYGIEPMCKVLHIAPSTWHEHAARKADPERRPNRAKTDEVLSEKIHEVFNDNFGVYGVRKIWRQLENT